MRTNSSLFCGSTRCSRVFWARLCCISSIAHAVNDDRRRFAFTQALYASVTRKATIRPTSVEIGIIISADRWKSIQLSTTAMTEKGMSLSDSRAASGRTECFNPSPAKIFEKKEGSDDDEPLPAPDPSVMNAEQLEAFVRQQLISGGVYLDPAEYEYDDEFSRGGC